MPASNEEKLQVVISLSRKSDTALIASFYQPPLTEQ